MNAGRKKIWVLASSLLIVLASALPADASAVGLSNPMLLQSEEEREHQRQLQEEERERQREQRELERERRQELREQEEDYYEEGMEALDDRDWEYAIEAFDSVARLEGRRADGALYWRAYAESKLGMTSEALATLDSLRQKHPQSRWLRDAKALEAEVRQGHGQAVSPEGEADEELKLLALNSLMNVDPERAVPMLEKFLQGSETPKLKDRALFVLAQSGSPRAREVIGRVARGESNPHLQMKAVKYLGLFGGEESRQELATIYAATTDVEVKRAILKSFMLAGVRGRLLTAAKGEDVPELRREAVHQLGVMGAREELWQLYQQETERGVREQILKALFISGDVDRMIEVARLEDDDELRLEAIHRLGLMGGPKTADALVSLYADEHDDDIRREVIKSLFLQGNAKALIAIARQETDSELKQEAVKKLSLIGSKEATDYLMEILNQ
jgi:HEAT repeat protein